MTLPPLDCNGCTTCCRGDTITLMKGDDPARYKTKLVDGRRVLAKGADGNCVYLGKSGCKIHGRAPLMCRVFDCRAYARMVDGWPEEKRRERLNNVQNRRTILEGRRRLAEPA